jgi:hypothetical protein
LADHTKFAETVVSLIQVNEGASKEDVIKSWDGTTSVVVGRALEDLDVTNITPTRGVITF